jgi:predicted PurR-regulated permease PerM
MSSAVIEPGAGMVGPASGSSQEEAREAARPAERPEMVLPEDPRTVFLGGLFLLASLGALYAASEIVLPIVLAFVLNLMLQPVVRLGERFRLPRALGALVAILLLVAVVAALGMALSGPATAWAERLPDAAAKLQAQLGFLKQPVAAAQDVIARVQGTAAPPGSEAMPVRLAGLFDTLFSGTRAVAAGMFTTLLVLFYLLIFGETFLRRTVEILPRFADKRRAVEISQRIERDLSAYLLTVSAINAVVGVATAAVMWLCGVSDPVLWGFAAFVLNFVPILGPLVGVVLLVLVGALSIGFTLAALLPAALYFTIHFIEGEVVTPLLLAKRFTINPVALVLALVFWYWMWGIPGAVLAVPMLAIAKIICDDIPQLRAFGHFLEG